MCCFQFPKLECMQCRRVPVGIGGINQQNAGLSVEEWKLFEQLVKYNIKPPYCYKRV
jgi:hypothetical protein